MSHQDAKAELGKLRHSPRLAVDLLAHERVL
jgi:hypothetical protein